MSGKGEVSAKDGVLLLAYPWAQHLRHWNLLLTHGDASEMDTHRPIKVRHGLLVILIHLSASGELGWKLTLVPSR